MEDFEKELKIGFLEEAEQAINEVEQCFLVLETNPNDGPVLDKIFRLAHNLKGSAKAVGFEEMGHFTHEFESFMLKLKNGELAVTKATVSLLLSCNDHLSQMVQALKIDLDAHVDSADLIAQIQAASQGGSIESSVQEEQVFEEIDFNPIQEDTPPSADAFEEEVPAQQFEETAQVIHMPTPVQAAPVMPATTVEVAAVKEPPAGASAKVPGSNAGQVDESIRVSLARVEKLLNFVGEMVILQAVLREQVSDSNSLLVKKTVHQLGKVTKEVQDMSMSLRMVPVKPTFQKMQRIVRDTANALNKTVNIRLQGEDTELDKTVLERINDPLVHLIRNSVDHGIESREERIAKGKSEAGTVNLSAYHQSGKLVLEVKDDGGGLNAEKLKQIAISKGVIKATDMLSEKECFALIFKPGFSTKARVTDISGRGVGMDVVRTNIEELGGEIQIDSQLGFGTSFKVFLPLTLAIIDGMVVKAHNERFVIPLTHVHESLKPDINDIKFTTGVGEVLLLRGENLPLYKLSQLLGKKVQTATTDMIAIVVRTGPKPFAILVEDIIGQYQVVIKQLGAEVQNIKGISGSTILGDGRPSLIIEPTDLILKDNKNSEPRRLAI